MADWWLHTVFSSLEPFKEELGPFYSICLVRKGNKSTLVVIIPAHLKHCKVALNNPFQVFVFFLLYPILYEERGLGLRVGFIPNIVENVLSSPLVPAGVYL